MSDSEVDADAIPADPLWEPATLPYVLREDKQRKADGGDKGKCQLCDMEDDKVPGACAGIREVYRTARTHRRSMKEKMRFQLMANQANRVIRKANEHPRSARLGWKELGYRDVRRHFKNDHVLDPLTTLYDEIDYIRATKRQMRHGNLWKRDAGDATAAMVPDKTNHDLYVKLSQHLVSLNREAARLEAQAADGTSGGGGAELKGTATFKIGGYAMP